VSVDIERYRYDVVAFLDEQVRVNELGKPFRLFDHERAILNTFFTFDPDGRLPYDTFIYSCTKKSGKTTINSSVNAWWASHRRRRTNASCSQMTSSNHRRVCFERCRRS
jgi:hypothetical protein